MQASPRASFIDELVRAGLDGDREAFDRGFDLAFAAIWRAALRRVGTQGAEAVTMDWLRRAVAERLLELEGSTQAAARPSEGQPPRLAARPTVGAR